MAETKIEWTATRLPDGRLLSGYTFNPVVGCQKVGPGCDNCYAEGWAKRSGLVSWGPGEDRRVTSDAYWRQPIGWNRDAEAQGHHRFVFCASLADVFDKAWPDTVRPRLAAIVRATPHLIWLFLTKRIGNAAAMLSAMFPEGTPANVWLGCTVVNQAEADRDISKLLAVPAAVRFLSVEPMLGPVDLFNWIGSGPYIGGSTHVGSDGIDRCDLTFNTGELDWVICGGESGPGARVWDGFEDAARSLRDQCAAARVAFFMKQMAGPRKATMPPIPADLMIREMPEVSYG